MVRGRAGGPATNRLGRLIDPDGAGGFAFRVSTRAILRACWMPRASLRRGRGGGGALDVAGVDLAAPGHPEPRKRRRWRPGNRGGCCSRGSRQAGGFRPGDFVTVRVEEPDAADRCCDGCPPRRWTLPITGCWSSGARRTGWKSAGGAAAAPSGRRRAGARAVTLTGREVVAGPLAGAGRGHHASTRCVRKAEPIRRRKRPRRSP